MKGLQWGEGFDSGLRLALLVGAAYMHELDPDYTLTTEYDETSTPAHLVACAELMRRIYAIYGDCTATMAGE